MADLSDSVSSRVEARIDAIACAGFDALALSNYTSTVGYLYALRDFRLLDEQQWLTWLDRARDTYCRWSGGQAGVALALN
ncbi:MULTISPECIES: hypothetical protein [unclassified Pseudomonas]|uniref:hypothetical protein n=1 Tax=unclassified Pseudomonas TaxID=196821 RepID=UPI000BD205F8|nr:MULTISPECIES: hypothetical protein [unclassified Pseudomonas]PVZ16233.1 hypothetical protein F474_01743 [Pseudomonas sp. URIL14HWK12:I12]PVZ25911.1 hypothetical protein F470_01367 [Pseudomonas sp. URIL14HWK12:I10]PVZ36565.1 hypothetical protein F472_01743 [Pseudomonas sp. URIL14HWK12:I11]SNZ13153.1 hypothetical protein SAMN05660463_02344 [Pseudomonas sp. URIL14HWK12:I9]